MASSVIKFGTIEFRNHFPRLCDRIKGTISETGQGWPKVISAKRALVLDVASRCATLENKTGFTFYHNSPILLELHPGFLSATEHQRIFDFVPPTSLPRIPVLSLQGVHMTPYLGRFEPL